MNTTVDTTSIDGGETTERARPGADARFAVTLGVITAVGLVLRLIYVVFAQRDETFFGDAFFYHHGANLLADGEGFIAPFQFFTMDARVEAADHPPLYLVFLSVPSFVGLRSELVHLVWSALLGTGTIVVAGFLGKRVAGPRVGWIAAGIVALYPNIWMYDGALLSETLAIFLATLVLLLAYRAWDDPTLGRVVALGAACGAAALARSELVLLVPGLLVPVVLLAGRLDRRARLRALGVGVIAAGLVMAPWVVYNLTRFEHPVLLSSQLEPTLAGANCHDTYEGPALGYISSTCLPPIDPTEDQSVNARIHRDEAEEFVRDNLGRVPVVVAARLGRVNGVFRPGQQIDIEVFEGRDRPLVVTAAVMYYGLAIGAVVGAIVLRRRRSTPVLPLVVVPAVVFVTIALTYGTNRFRTTAETALAVLAAVALDAGVTWVAAKRRARPAGLA
jgi:4-amino-4-deoxy-L-arabinose transferase-like glycosyltransferase